MKIYIDLDGTIIDVWNRYYIVLNNFLIEEYNLTLPIDIASFKKYKLAGQKEDKIVYDIFHIQIDVDKFVSYKRNNLEDIRYLQTDKEIADIKEFARRVKSLGYNLELVTRRRNEDNLYQQLQMLNIIQCFDKITFINFDSMHKKDYLDGILRQEDVVIGDSMEELSCAINAKAKGYFVRSGLIGYDEDTLQQQGIISINDYTEVLKLI